MNFRGMSASCLSLVVVSLIISCNLLGQNEVTLTMAVNDVSWGNVDPAVGTHVVNKNEAVSIQATAAAGYVFSKWTGGNNVTIADETAASTTATLSKDATVSAVFAESAGETVTLTMAVNDASWGNVDPAVGTHVVNKNEAVSIQATAAAGYVFSKWTGGNNVTIADETAASTTAALSKDATVSAIFAAAPKEVTLTMIASPDDGGSTSPEAGDHTVESGEQVNISATAADGYQFNGWNASGGATVQNPTNATTTVTLEDDGEVTALFAPDAMEDLQIGQIRLVTTNAAIGKDKITLKNGIIPAGFPTLTADSVVTVVVGGCSTRCANFSINADKGRYETTFEETGGAKVSLKFDTTKNQWSFTKSKTSAFDDFNFNVDPTTLKTSLLIYLNVSGGNYGTTFEMDEKTSWKWKTDENLSEDLNIEVAKGKFCTNTSLNPADKKDSFCLNKATLSGFTPEPNMFNGVEVTIRIDNLDFEQAFTLEQPKLDKESYRASVDTGTGVVKMALKQVDSHYFMKLTITKTDCSGVKGPDINVRLSLGSVYKGNFKIPSVQKTNLSYKAP